MSPLGKKIADNNQLNNEGHSGIKIKYICIWKCNHINQKNVVISQKYG